MTQRPTMRSRTRTTTQAIQAKHEEIDYLSSREDEMNGEDAEWIDEDEEETMVRSERLPQRPSSPAESMISVSRTSPRKRGARKASYAINGPRKQAPLTTSRKPSPPTSSPEPEEVDYQIRDAVLNGLIEGTLFISRYVLDILGIVSRLLRLPISIFLLLWLLSFMIGHMSQTVRRAFEPLCIIPGISSSSMCRPQDSNSSSRGNSTPKWADYSTLVKVQSKSFEQLLEDSAGGSALSLEIKKAEMATTDLVVRIRISDLKAKDTLAASLAAFVADAKKTGRSLQKLTSKVGGAVDNIMAVNDYALQSIEAARANEPSPWSFGALAPWKPRSKVNEIVMKTFDEAMNVLSTNMERLIVEAEYNFNNLKNLEERLATVHEIVSREDSTISSAKSDLLEDLWSKLGGNRKSLRNFDHHLALLKGLSTYRKQALVHVVAALQTLHAMSEDMEDMRERVAAPDLIGSQVPAEVHMKSIQMGLERLREGRIRAKRLEEEAMRKVLSIN